MEKKGYISLVELAQRFAKAKGLADKGYKWLRVAPGRSTKKDEQVGNSLAVQKAIRAFNAKSNHPIEVLSARGYDGTPRKVMLIGKDDIIRLKGFITRSGSKRSSASKSATPFKIMGKVDI
jgi:hypothetical protein